MRIFIKNNASYKMDLFESCNIRLEVPSGFYRNVQWIACSYNIQDCI